MTAPVYPPWLKKRWPASAELNGTRDVLRDLDLATVCENAHCPNLGECFARRTATFLILGSTCTRDCRFCAVKSGAPRPADAAEPDRVAEAAARLGLKHVVVTSVTRDDLPDGGAGQFAATIRAVRAKVPGAVIEVLTPDFHGREISIRAVAEAFPAVYGHNVETVPRLYGAVRPGAAYGRSLGLLRLVKDAYPAVLTKSGVMVGLGEEIPEIITVMADLRRAGCDILTIGQYLRPTAGHLPVAEFVTPRQFEDYRLAAQDMGFLHVQSGPFVRSSYHAWEVDDIISSRSRA